MARKGLSCTDSGHICLERYIAVPSGADANHVLCSALSDDIAPAVCIELPELQSKQTLLHAGVKVHGVSSNCFRCFLKISKSMVSGHHSEALYNDSCKVRCDLLLSCDSCVRDSRGAVAVFLRQGPGVSLFAWQGSLS